MKAHVLSVTATYRRPRQLGDLLASLSVAGRELGGAIVIDNAEGDAVCTVGDAAWPAVERISPGENLGCGGGVALGLRMALRDPAMTHVWILDDDAQATPGALTALVEGIAVTRADMAVPLVTDGEGRIGWFPGPLDQPAWNVIRSPDCTPADFRRRCGTDPRDWTWAPWPALLVSRRAIETVGVPRDDYWFQGEDLEWTLRLSARFRGVLVPHAECRHLPPGGNAAADRLKGAAMLQNNLFTGTRLPHGRRILRHAPGNVFRFWRANGVSLETLGLAWRAHWFGAICGWPAGRPRADYFRRCWQACVA